jgi:agmatine deiminase
MRNLSLIISIFICTGLLAQENVLPRNLSHEELHFPEKNENESVFKIPQNGIHTVPTSPLRAPAEWEEIQSLVISWIDFTNILSEIVRHARLECNVIICVKNAATEASARNTLTAKGIDLSSNVQFVIRDYNSIWVRDYGPNTCYTNDVDSLVLVDWVYNRPRPTDDTLSYKIAEVLQLPIYATNLVPNKLVHTGGNFMTDGNGLGFSSKLVLNENPNLSENTVDSIMGRYHGLSEYVKMETLKYDIINHIDMHMKLLDEETLLVGQYPIGIADGPQIEANLQYVLSGFKTKYGKPFKVVRVVMPPEGTQYPPQGDYRTYANAIFVNKTVLVPTYASPHDSTALSVWRKTLPGYKIVAINCNAMIYQSGALHCITKEIGAHDPLWINYEKLPDVAQNPPSLTYPLTAQIKHKHGLDHAILYYRLSTDSMWSEMPMQQGLQPDSWFADIPHQPDGSLVYYYVEATGNSGKRIAKPLPAPLAYNQFQIQQSSSTSAVKIETEFEVFPNPAKAITCVHIQNAKTAHTQVRLIDVQGRVIQVLHDGMLSTGEHRFFFDASELSAGAYLVDYQSGSNRLQEQVIVID